MSAFPKQIRELFDLDGSPRSLQDCTIGEKSDLWFFDEAVVQLKPGCLLPRFIAIQEVAEGMQIPGIGFSNMAIQNGDEFSLELSLESTCDWLWLKQPYIPGTYAHVGIKGISPKDIMYRQSEALADVCGILSRLAAQPIPELLTSSPLPDSLLRKTLSNHELAKYAGQELAMPESFILPEEPSSEIVLSHGDPTIKNTIIRTGGSVLIDWEFMHPLPRHYDLTHIAAYLCRWLPHPYWEQASSLVWSAARHLLGQWSKDDCDQAMYWALIRGAVIAYDRPDDTVRDYWQGMHKMLNF